MKILGIDPGTWNTGVGFIEAKGNQYQLLHYEVISVKKGTRIEKRLQVIYETLMALMAEYKPSIVALENVFYGKDIRATVKIGEARACAMLASATHNIEIVEYAPARVKQAVCGNGRASKEQVQHMIARLLNLKEMPLPDGADALAVAICHLHCFKRKRLVEVK